MAPSTEGGRRGGGSHGSHASPSELRRLSTGGTDAGLDRAREHVAAGCPRCAGELRRLLVEESDALGHLSAAWALGEEEPSADLLNDLTGRSLAWELLFEAEDRLAAELADELLRLPTAQRTQTARESRRYRSLALARHLADRARRAVFEDPGQAVELGRLAVAMSEQLVELGYPPGLAHDVCALAWGALGNAHRVNADLFEANRALGSATEAIQTGSGHPLVEVEVFSLLGSLRRDQTRYEEGRRVLERAVAICADHAPGRRQAQVVLKLGQILTEHGEPESAAGLLREALELVPEEDGRLRLLTGYSLAVALNDAGRCAEAQEEIDELQPEYDRYGGDPWMAQRWSWLGGRLAAARGDRNRAEEVFRDLRQSCAERESSYDYALATLELACLLLEEGRAEEVVLLAHEMVPVFASHRIHGHALAALALFQTSAASRRATTELTQRVLRYLQRARNNPHLKFSS